MEYKYMKVSNEGEKTIGIRTYSNNESAQTSEEPYPNRIEILQQEYLATGGIIVSAAKLAEGYYPISYFKPSSLTMADIIPDSGSIKPRLSRNLWDYIGPVEEGEGINNQ